jgi:hypothetical protein
MKRPIAILFMFLMLLQAIPVLNFFSERNFYVYVDEDKPEETKLKVKKDGGECIAIFPAFTSENASLKKSCKNSAPSLPSPYLDSFTPPPNIAC